MRITRTNKMNMKGVNQMIANCKDLASDADNFVSVSLQWTFLTNS